jgi:hypothetical protein
MLQEGITCNLSLMICCLLPKTKYAICPMLADTQAKTNHDRCFFPEIGQMLVLSHGLFASQLANLVSQDWQGWLNARVPPHIKDHNHVCGPLPARWHREKDEQGAGEIHHE